MPRAHRLVQAAVCHALPISTRRVGTRWVKPDGVAGILVELGEMYNCIVNVRRKK